MSLDVLVRGWLHGNVVRLPGALIDAGYHTGVADVLEGCGSVQRVLLTHVHSDHAGGVAEIVAATGATVFGHADAVALVGPWDEEGLWLVDTGQELPRFAIDEALGRTVEAGGRRWHVLDTPGHAVGGVAYFDESEGVVVTGDALWEDGFGLLNPWFDPPGVFERARRALENLREVGARVVIPGHGAPFTDVAGALDRADARLEYLVGRPDRLRAQVLRNTAGFLRLARPAEPLEAWAERVRIMSRRLAPLPGDHGPSPEALAELVIRG